jgi:hypothetical protein
MNPDVVEAAEEIKRSFPEHQVEVTPEAQGGAYVIVRDLDLGDKYEPATSWCGFLITFQYPHADVYPHFIDGRVRRKDGCGHGSGISGPMDWQRHSALQISRRSNRWNPAIDTAAAKLAKVLEWLRAQ